MFYWVWSKLSEVTVTNIASLNSQDTIRIAKESGNDLRLCDGFCNEILCDLDLWRLIFKRLIWFYEKASLRAWYIILMECKGPRMITTGSLTF